MKKMLIIAAGVLLVYSANSQDLQIEKGQKIESETILYANALPLDKKWAKLKDDKRDELILELNSKIEAGIEKPWRTTSAKFEVIDVKNANGAAEYTVKAYDSGFEYQSTSYLTKDTTYLVRNASPIYSILNGDTLGMSIQGIQKIPNVLKVGDKLPQYTDFAFTFPKTWTSKMSEKVYAGRKSESHSEFGAMVDSRTGELSVGEFKVTTSTAIYDNINHEVQISENISSNIIHYYSAYCTGTETMTIGKKEQTAYIIESQQWAKAKVNREYSAERQDLANKTAAEFEKFVEKMSKKTAKRGYTNPDGYVVTYFREWFLPGYGIVKSESYDMYGAIQSQSKIKF